MSPWGLIRKANLSFWVCTGDPLALGHDINKHNKEESKGETASMFEMEGILCLCIHDLSF